MKKLVAVAEKKGQIVYGRLIKTMFQTVVCIHVIVYCIYGLFPNKKFGNKHCGSDQVC